MNVIRKARATVSDLENRGVLFFVQTIQWRLSTASCVYVIIVNSLYWAFVLSADLNYQIMFLDALTVYLITRLLLIPLLSVYKPITTLLVQHRPGEEERKSPDVKPSPSLVKQLVNVLILLPFSHVICPLFRFLRYLLFDQTVKVFTLAACYATKMLLANLEDEKACLLAYATVLLMLVAPPWNYYQVHRKMFAAILFAVESIVSFFVTRVFQPVVHFGSNVFFKIRYVVCGWWISPLIGWFRRRLVDPVLRGWSRFMVLLKYYACGGWIPPFKQKLVKLATSFLSFIKFGIVDPVFAFSCWLNDWLVYLVTLRWLLQLLILWYGDLKTAYHERCVPPFRRAWSTVCYFCSGVWLTDFVRRFLQASHDYFTRCISTMAHAVTYTLSGQWLKDFYEYLKALILASMSYAQQKYVRPFVLDVEMGIRRLARRIVCMSKSVLFRLKFFVIYRLVLPGFYSTLLSVWIIIQASYINIIQPLALFVFDATTRFWQSSGRDVVQKLVSVFPERSFFVEDSDSELKDFLPMEAEDNSDDSRRSSVSSSSSKSTYDDLLEMRSSQNSNGVKDSNRSSAEFEKQLAITAVSDTGSSYSEEDEDQVLARLLPSKRDSLISVDSRSSPESRDELAPSSLPIDPRLAVSSSSDSMANNTFRKTSSGCEHLPFSTSLLQSQDTSSPTEDQDPTGHSDFELLEADTDSDSSFRC